MKTILSKTGAAQAQRYSSSNLLVAAVAMAIALPGAALAEVEMYGYVKNETAVLTGNGQFIGEAQSTVDANSHHDEFFKFETSAHLFVNGEIGENATWHAELAPVYDAQAIKSASVDYRGHENYTQQDWLRELYVDTSVGNVDLRIGKQQVVWGTADGIKLLDIINPTDFRELNQNTIEDARIPIWMATAEMEVGDAGNLQFVLSQAEENKIAGLNASGDSGHAFILKGVDSITGKVNGFLNVTPALAKVATNFHLAAFGRPGVGTVAPNIGGGFFDVNNDGFGDTLVPNVANPFTLNPTSGALALFGGLTVDSFASNTQNVNDPNGSILATGQFSGDESIVANPALAVPAGTVPIPGATLLNNLAQTGSAFGFPAANDNNNVTNLVTASYDASNPDSAFEFMPNATFATFNTFAGSTLTPGGASTSATTQYVREYPDSSNPNFGFRYKANLENGLNFSLNYFYHYDANPSVSLSWHDAVTNEKLQTILATPGDFANNGFPDFADPTSAAVGAGGTFSGATVAPSAVPTDLTAAGALPVTVLLRNAAGQFYGATAPNPTLAVNTNGVNLRFTEKLNRVNSLGGAFDYALEAGALPVVIRGEFLYDKNVKTPVVDKLLLGIGDLENALTIQDADMFKYVLGVDVTVLTNLLVSSQFIQFRNLDFVEQNRTCRTATRANPTVAGQTSVQFDCSRYTGDPATLHLTNGLNKGEENKEFVSVFLSKPFGPEQQGRWNNIIIFEDTGGRWNRFDVEYGLTDNFIVSAEWNQYWGDKNSTFGQLKESSSLQLGLKYIFE